MVERFTFPELAASNIKLENWLSTPREKMTLSLGEAYDDDDNREASAYSAKTISFQPCSIHHAHSQIGHAILIRALVDGQDFEILCDMAIVQDLIKHGFGPVDQSLLASRERALILEHVLGGPISMMERDFGFQTTFHWAAPDVPPDLAQIGAICVTLDGRVRPGYAVLHGNGASAELFRKWVDSCELQGAKKIDPVISISLVFGATTLSLADLKDLDVGDTILIDDKFHVERPLRAIAGKSLVADARFFGQKIEALSGFTPLRGAQAYRWMIEANEGVQIDMNDTSNISTNHLSDMKVKLVFEVGRTELNVSDIEKLGPGHVFQISRATEGHVDVIAGGRVIGSGELVKIGDDIGVRLKRIAS